MIRFALKFCAGLLAAAVAACIVAPEAAAPPPVGGGHRVGAVPQECRNLGIENSADFVARKVRLASFDPTTNPAPVNLGSSSAPGAPYNADLAAAFDAAPQTFQAQLCGLDGVIVNTNGCESSPSACSADPHVNSWGLREKRERNPNRGGRYIAVSAALWSPTLPTLSSFQNTLLNSLLAGWTNIPTKPSIINSGGSGGGDNTQAMTLLAVLAHEFGHVLWYDTMNLDRDPNYQVNERWCQDINFFAPGWGLPATSLKPPIWRRFAGNNLGNTIPMSWFAVLRENIRNGAWNNAINTLGNNGIYGNQLAYPSLFGGYSPDEDFVETFTLAVLLMAQNGHQLQNLMLQIPSQPSINIAARGRQQGDLHRKIACFGVH